MKDLFEIEDMLENLAEEIEPLLPIIPKFLSDLKNTDKPLSIFSMTSFFPKVESIRIGIFEMAKIEEYYSMNILFRSLIEHFIKSQYIWMKTLDSKNDEVGIDYWLFGKDQEIIDYSKALHQSYSLIGVISKSSLTEVLTEMGILSKDKSANLIRQKMEQFKFKKMTHYISEKLNTTENSSPTILRAFFPLYSELSSNVHGGPESAGSYENGPESMKEILEMSTFASLYTRWLMLILIYQYEKNVGPLCQITQKYLHKFVGHNNLINAPIV